LHRVLTAALLLVNALLLVDVIIHKGTVAEQVPTWAHSIGEMRTEGCCKSLELWFAVDENIHRERGA
jgi:hypothetical protein